MTIAIDDEAEIPKSMASCLDFDDPVAALQLLSTASAKRAYQEAEKLKLEIETMRIDIPMLLQKLTPDHPLVTSTACADSVHHTLTKIASGGSQASQEIRKLEDDKRDVDEHAQALQKALQLRKNSDRAAQSFSAAAYADAAEALQVYLEFQKNPDPRVRSYTGEYSFQQLQTTYEKLRSVLVQNYEAAVQNSDLQALGQLTPILSALQLEQEGVRLYKQFLERVLEKSLQEVVASPPLATTEQQPQSSKKLPPPPYVRMGKIYNTSVTTLRHHLPMVSHCLYKADGATVMVQLVHVETERFVLPVLREYRKSRQLSHVAHVAGTIYAALEEKYTGRQNFEEDQTESDAGDCGFSTQIGSLADVDAAMEETALCIQHSVSYLRFLQHTCDEVKKARQLRFQQEMERARMESERLEWSTGQKATTMPGKLEYQEIVILPSSTPLHESVAEIGGEYAAIERCLLLASMQKAFAQADSDDPRFYRPMSTLPGGQSAALQTVLVETCFFAARRGTQRAFATGHTGTASAMTNFCTDCLTDILLAVLTRRAEDLGVSRLKPGEGLLVGSVNLFNNASNLIRQGGPVGVVHATAAKTKEELIRKQKAEESAARACAMINDLEVVFYHTKQLEGLLNKSIEKGFPPNSHETEQLVMCVKSLGAVADNFRVASDSTIESLESVLKQRIRSIVGEAVGSDSSTFMGASAVMGGGKAGDRVTVRMNYDLDEETYNLLQLSEGYVLRLCTLLDELLEPLKKHLAPRLWDTLLLSVISTACKRLETSLRKCHYTSLGGLALDSDMRDLLNYTKDQLLSTEYSSNAAILRACPALSRLLQISYLMSVDDLEDVLDLISSSRRKGAWDIKLEDAKAFLSLRVDFDAGKVSELLRLPDDN
jgi:hypothetical protein